MNKFLPEKPPLLPLPLSESDGYLQRRREGKRERIFAGEQRKKYSLYEDDNVNK